MNTPAATDSPRDWAAHMLTPGTAVICDVETTALAGAIIEIAVIDAATGQVLLDTLVDPGPIRIEPSAQAVHGISALELLHAPTWSAVAHQLEQVVDGRTILAYNADFDHSRVVADNTRYHLKLPHIRARTSWDCVMAARTVAENTPKNLCLDAAHRALGDVAATRDILLALAAGHSTLRRAA